MQAKRRSGILLHPTSLPGAGGIGTLGDDAYAFVDFLEKSGQSLWQVLPIGPTAYGNSPYSAYSAFAGNPLLINLQMLAADGDIGSMEALTPVQEDRVDYDNVIAYKMPLLREAAREFFLHGSPQRREEFSQFCDTQLWLDDYALFMALKDEFQGEGWRGWPQAIALRDQQALQGYSEKLRSAIEEHKYMQWQFFRQWSALKTYANTHGVEIFGDLPIFVAYDSADVWANPHLFHLDENGAPTVVAGVPPDYFSETGQLWGNPLYNWESMAYHGFSWWIERFRSAFTLYDLLRVDHFRGFESYWEVPAHEKTAVHGRWVKGPGDNLFHAVRNALGELPIIAEDLGVITPEVEELRDQFNFPGMKILHFAFGSGPDNPYLPHNHVRNCVIYTGTHDNDTTVGWFRSLSEEGRGSVLAYIGTSGNDIAWEMMRVAMSSVADYVIIPFQDLLSLPTEGRMNLPGTPAGNWSWRMLPESTTAELANRLYFLGDIYGRLMR